MGYLLNILSSIFLFVVVVVDVQAQYDVYSNNYDTVGRPTVTPDLLKYFELDGHARQLVDTIIGPRPGGFFPEKTYDVVQPVNNFVVPQTGPQPPDSLTQIGKAVENFLSGPPSPSEPQQQQLPPGFNQGFSLKNDNNNVLSSGKAVLAANVDESPANTNPAKSSISGIPNNFPKLPKFPFSSYGQNTGATSEVRRKPVEPVELNETYDIPKFASRPEVPDGGMGPAADVRRHPASVYEAPLSSSAADASEYGTLTDETNHVPGGLIGTVLDLFKMNKEGGKSQDASGIGKAVTNLLGSPNSPLPGKNMISNVLYKALTSGTIQNNDTMDIMEFNASKPIILTKAQQSAIGENLEMIQNLIAQPSSPLCNPKPVPVAEFNMNAFMGQWYQVMYSPILTQSACSVVSYKKLSDINNGGIGSIFEIFEYTTDGTPYSKPKITSGYAILKQTGELIFRTTAHQDDVNIHVLFNGPINTNGQYDFTIMSTNCNYPVYVFARDPIVYKQRYEMAVNEILEQKGIINGISKLLNVVAPVDASTCTFPPTLFNFKG